MTEYRLRRSALPSIRFTGQLIALSPRLIGAALAQRGRWTQIALYTLAHSPLYLVHVHYASDHPQEDDNYLAALTSDPQAYLATLDASEWSSRAPPDDLAAVREQFAQACAALQRQLDRPERLTINP